MNLIIIESPLQLLCAFEAIKTNPGIPYKLLLRKNKRGLNDFHLENSLSSMDLEYESFILRPNNLKRDLLANAPLWIRILSKNYNQIYLGSFYSSFLNTLKKGLRGNEIYFLDDGASTLRAQSDIVDGKVQPCNWFTFFNLNPQNGQIVKYHSFNNLRKHYSKNFNRNSYFIGQPVHKMDNINENQYLNRVKKIADNFSKSEPLLYIPHRIEKIESLKHLSNIKIIRPDRPLELYFLQKGISPPLEIFGFYSTALISLKKIFPEIKSYCINSSLFNNKDISLIFKHYKENGVIEINLD